MIVMKFGGTSNQDASAMKNVIRLVKARLDERPFVVISAIARATNELEQTARLAQEGNETDALALLDRLFERHADIQKDLVKEGERSAALTEKFRRYQEELQRLVRGIAILGELTPRSMDAVCAYGERLSSSLIAAGLQEEGVDAVWLDTRDFMITDDNFGNARPLMDLVGEYLERVALPLLAAGRVPVTQGFIGVTRNGLPTTMGRESSDYSASIIGAAMHAAVVQIWTDVDGVLSADPSVVQRPKLIDRMSFQEAFELSYFGAKVLHPNTMLPVLGERIPVQILNSKNEKSNGTLVGVGGDGRGTVKSIAYKRGMSVLTVTPEQRVNQYLFWEGVYTVLNQHNVATGTTATSEYSLAIAVDGKADVVGLVRELGDIGNVTVTMDLGAVCLVGLGIHEKGEFMGRVFSALGSTRVHLIAGGPSEVSMTLVIRSADVDEAVRKLHREFFEKKS